MLRRSLFLSYFFGPAMLLANSEGVSTTASDLFKLGPITVTNSILTTWLVSAVIILAVQFLVGTPKLVPNKGQAIVEGLAQGLRDVFPVLCGFFVFILLMNWSGLLPGVGTLKYQVGATDWKDLLRPANSDLNTTLALSVVSFAAWTYFVLRYAGIKTLVYDLFGNKSKKSETHIVMWILLSFIFLGVGCIEIISILSRLISLSFRLYGNVYGGESLVHSLSAVAKWGAPAASGLLEVLVGLIQAFVFTLLSAIYIGLICNHDGGHADDEHAH
jgi:F-type H+-transporting ATPase subunit a